MVKITACTVAYHEEKLIERFLKSFKGTADEIIVVHDGPCKDKTLEIARRYTNNVFVGPRKGDLAPHLQFCLNKAKSEWVIALGADEFITKELKREMKKLVEDKNSDAYQFRTEIWCNGKLVKRGVYGNFWRLLLYRKSKVINERVRVNGAFRTAGKVKRAPYFVCHRHDYDNFTMETFRKKWMRLIRLEAAEMIELGMAGKPAFLYFATAPFTFLHHFWTLFKQDITSSGWYGWKITFYLSLYYFMRNVMVGKLKVTGISGVMKLYNIPYPRNEETYAKYIPKKIASGKRTS